MSYKTILVHVDGSRHVNRRVEIAASLAAQYDACLVGVAVTGMPPILLDPLMLNPVDPALDPILKVPRERAADALANFESRARQTYPGPIETRLEENESALGISLQARYCDLLVLGQFDPDDTEASITGDFAQTVILESGVPVLMIPFASAVAGAGRRVLVSWNASKQAVRAVHYALPMLQRAAHVDVVVFDPEKLPSAYRAVPDKDILAWMGHHGIAANVIRQATTDDIKLGSALLSLASDLGSDLLVMGCYGHTRFREILLGGVTREILRTMSLPVLMAH